MNDPIRMRRRSSVESLELRRLLAADIQILADINMSPANSDTKILTTIGTDAYFTARDKIEGLSLWKTDGTEGGTELIKGFGASQSSDSLDFATAGKDLYLVVGDGISHHDIWKSDGTEQGTQLLKRLPAPFAGARMPGFLTAFGNQVFFTAWDETHGQELWRTDGTAAGTALLKDLEPGFENESFPADFVVSEGQLFFTARTTIGAGGLTRKLWTSDGTAAGTVPVDDANIPASLPVTHIGQNSFFVRFDAEFGRELWVTDEGGESRLVKDVLPGPGSAAPQQLTAVGDTLYFVANDGVSGQELWKTDGTEVGTELVLDLRSGMGDSTPKSLTAVGGDLYFVAQDRSFQRDLWKTDGTVEGTVLLRENPTRTDEPSFLTNVGGSLYFSSDEPSNPTATLWRSDGTPEGTTQAKSSVGGTLLTPNAFFGLGDALLFSAFDEVLGQDLWMTDGTDEGTRRVQPNPAGNQGSNPTSLTVAGEQLFFRTRAHSSENLLWTSDGTSEGTTQIGDLGNTFNPQLFASGNHFYFVKETEAGNGLWFSDGTTAGTRKVKALPTGIRRLEERTDLGGILFFVSNRQLWRSDGTDAGTFPVEGLSPDLNLVDLTSVGGRLFFSAEDDEHGRELWSSDGTGAGTGMVIDLEPGTGGSHPFSIGSLDDALVFSAGDGGIYRSDGTDSGTELIGTGIHTYSHVPAGRSAVVGNELFFGATTAQGYSIVKTDGTAAGTKVMIGGLPSDDEESLPSGLTSVGDSLFFVTRIGGSVYSKDILWQSDGTEAGTIQYPHFYPEFNRETFSSLTEVQGQLLLAVKDVMWQIDPRTAESIPLMDASGRPAPRSSFPFLVVAKDVSYFVGTSHEFGTEVFRLTLLPDAAHRTGDFNADGTTDFADFLILSANFGKDVVDTALGDATEDGRVTFADFLILSSNFTRDN